MSIRLAALSGFTGILAAGAASADVPRVATDIAPVHSLVARVMGALGEPSLIVRPGSSPHRYALRPSDARNLQDADAVFWVGPELEPWLEDTIGNLAPDAVAVALLAAPSTQVLEFRAGATFAPYDQGDDDHAHDDHAQAEAHDQHGHDHGADGQRHDGIDPHAWLDPENGKIWLDRIAEKLGELDAENAEAYARNAVAGKAEIDAAMDAAAGRLDPVSDLRFVVFHDAYQYYEMRFGLSASGAIALSDASDPSPARVEEVRDSVRDLGASCIFSEPQFNQSLVRTVAEGTDVTTGTIDPLGTEIALGPDFYPRLITAIADDIVSCGE